MIKLRSVLTPFFLFLLLAMSIAAQKRAAPARDYFPLRVGHAWTYRNDIGDTEYTVKVVSEEKQADGTIHYLVEKQVGLAIQSWYSKPAGLVLMHREAYSGQEGLDVRHEPARQFLKNPLVAGTKWFWNGKGITGADVSESYQVVGPEVVEVAAGRFRAMKIVGKVADGSAPIMTKTYWYADGVGLVKSLSEGAQLQNGWELVSYNFKKTSSR
jgi:hypothetical protein